MQANKTTLEELPRSHLTPTVVVGVADNETRKNKEEIDSKIAVVDFLVEVARSESLKDMKPYNHQRRNTSQTI
jgi:hypothetical protein